MSTLSAVLIALTSTTAAAGPKRFNAVPTSVWSALNCIAATPSSKEKIIPTATLARITAKIITGAAIPAGRYFIINAPPKAPITMIPSKPMLITPLCSEKHPPSATSTRTEANINVYWINNNIMPYPLSALLPLLVPLPLPVRPRPSFPLFYPKSCSARF